ncbi:MAG: hypothetical protein WKF87_05215 [Chryseolinea sp.]
MKTIPLPYSRSKVLTKELPTKSKPAIDVELIAALDPLARNDSYVYVHCYLKNEWQDALVRIWKTTFLVDNAGSRSGLIHAENITFAPIWTLIPDRAMHSFLLIFDALPKGCGQFDLVEEIPQPGGFHVTNIQRNQQDVYHIDL